MKEIKHQEFGGERPLFGCKDLKLTDITIVDGESGIKQCENIEAEDCKFYGKYPWWHVDGARINNCYFAPGSRSAIWYTNNLVMKNSVIDGPKFFREMENVELENVTINDADETFWKVKNLRLKNVTLNEGTYPFMFSEDIFVDGLKSNSKYVFQYCKNVEVHHADIVTKDSFWECENVTIYDSVLDGEYLAWHSKNVAALLCRQPDAGELHLRRCLRPCVRILYRTCRHPWPHREHQEPDQRAHRGRRDWERDHRRVPPPACQLQD